jgi:hypothetical protein
MNFLKSFNEPPQLVPLVAVAQPDSGVLTGLAHALTAAVAWFPPVSCLPISIVYPFVALWMGLILLLAPLSFKGAYDSEPVAQGNHLFVWVLAGYSKGIGCCLLRKRGSAVR